MPDQGRQFRVLFRDFLGRMVDLEILSGSGDIGRLLMQFAAMLAAFSLTFAMFTVSKYVGSNLPHARMAVLARTEEEFLIAATMAIAGLFSVLAWNTILPSRRDCLVLGVLPVRLHTIFAAKVAAISSALAISVAAVNVVTGLYTPFIAAPENAGVLALARTFAAYWIALFAAAVFVCGSLLALQGLAAQFLSYRLFLRVSGFLQLASFFTILGVFFLKPPFPNPRCDAWLPSFWFFGLFQSLNGNPEFGGLALRAAEALAQVLALAGLTFAMAYGRSIRKIVEQPDIAPADRSRPSARAGTWLVRRVLRKPVDRAVVLFTARGIARSRQHRLLLACYMGIGLAIALAYAREYIYGPANYEAMRLHAPWNQPNVPFLAGTLVLLWFALIGTRAVFAMPIALAANWVFRITAVHSPASYFRAARRSLLALGAVPVWIAATALFFVIWPPLNAAEHVALMLVVGSLIVAKSMRWFRKIPFACSYLPGKANLHIRLGAYGCGFLFVADKGVELELWTMHHPVRFAVLLSVLLAATIWAWRNTLEIAGAKATSIQFDEQERAEVDPIDLRRDGAWSQEEAYIDHDDRRDPPAAGGSGLGNAGLIRLGIAAGESAAEPKPPLRVRVEQTLADLRYGVRVLAKAPGFSAAAIALVAMGIGGNATIYSLIHGVLSRPAPGMRAPGLVSMGASVNGDLTDPGVSYSDYAVFAHEVHSIRGLAAFQAAPRFSMQTEDGGQYQMRGQYISADYFGTFGVRMAVGRSFNAEEMTGAGSLPCILAYHVWENQFGRAPDILGRRVSLNGRWATIVGVSERGFHGTGLAPQFEVGVPLLPNAGNLFRSNLELIGRLAPGVSMAAAQAEFDAVSRRLEELDPERHRARRVVLAPYTATAFGPNSGRQARFFMAILAAVALLTLLVVCANVANLMLARAVIRQREMAVRLSMGASRIRIIRILLGEGLAISLLAAGAAMLFAEWATRALLSWLPPVESGARLGANLTPDWKVAGYAVLLAAFSALAFTLAPSLQTWKQDVLPWLKSGEQCVVPGRSRLAHGLVVVQIALCFVLLTGAAMLQRSARLVDAGDLGFRQDHLLLIEVDTSKAVASAGENRALLERLRERLGGTRGVTTASYATAAPPRAAVGLRVESGTSLTSVDGNYVGPDFLAALGVPVLEGRAISASDAGNGAAVALVNRKLAKSLWPGEQALGRVIQVEGASVQVIGIVPDGAYSAIGSGGSITGLAKEDRPRFVFLSGAAFPPQPGGRVFAVRYTGALSAVAPAVRAALRETDARVPVLSMRTMEAEWNEFMSPFRFIAALLAVFATGSLLLAAVGLYAVASFYTARRTREFGIRLALGASPARMIRGVLREAAVLAGIGIGVGAALSAAAARGLQRVLYGLGSAGAVSWTTAVVLLAIVTVAAAWLPARRASRTDPMSALRTE